MPRPQSENPSPHALRQREADRRKREGLVLVRIGADRYEISAEDADQVRRAMKVLERKARQPERIDGPLRRDQR